MKQAFVVGGQANFVKKTLAKSLARHGINIHTHWSWDKQKPPLKLPGEVDLVYVCTDMVAHKVSVPCMDMARESGRPYVNGTRKWAESIERLTAAGFPLLDPVASLPDIIAAAVATKTPKQVAAGPSEADLKGLMVALTGQTDPTTAAVLASEARMPSTVTMAAVANAPVAHSTPLVPPDPKEIPAVPNANASKPALNVTDHRQQIYLRAIISNPTLTNSELWEAVRTSPVFAGRQFDPQRGGIAREQLGISIVRKNGERRVAVDLNKFKETAKNIGVTNYPEPQALYVSVDRTAIAPAAEAAPAPAPAPTPVKPLLNIAPTKERPDGMEELKDLLTLVRVKMAEESITELHLTPDGVKFKQVKVVEGELAV